MSHVAVKTRRMFEVLPLLAALVFYGISLRCSLFALAVGISVTVFVILDWSASSTTRRWYTAGGIGLLAGLALLAVSVPPFGLLPPTLLSGLTGMLIGFAILGVLTRRVFTVWITAWMLVAVSGQAAMSAMLGYSLVAFVSASLIGAASQAKVLRLGLRSVLPFSLFAVLVALATLGFAKESKRIDGVLMHSLESIYTPNSVASKTGLGSEITIKAVSSITLSQRPLMDLSAKPEYLRTHVMDRFDGRQWSTSLELRSTSHTLSEVKIRPELVRKIEMFPLDELGESLPSPAGTWKVRGANPRIDGGWALWGTTQAAGITITGDANERLPLESGPGKESLAVPAELMEKLSPLTEQLTGTHPTDREETTSRKTAEKIERFFQDNFEYSLSTNLASQDHPLVTLVKERRPAYCIYFASAMAVMLRTQGIPARVVSGFAPVEVNPLTNRVTVRQRDAHAWVEAWLSEEGRFVAFDPTPSGSRQQVIGYSVNPGSFSALLKAAGSFARRTWLALRHDPVGLLAKLIKSPLMLFPFAGLVVVFFRRRMNRHNALAGGPKMDSSDPVLRQVYGRYLISLKREGIAPTPSETDDELITRMLETTDPAIVSMAKEFIARYREARFRGDAIDRRLMELAELSLPEHR